MSANLKTRAIDNAVDRSGGLAWNRLHSEREDICEVLLKESARGVGTEMATYGVLKEEVVRTSNWHKELLQARLRKIDDALDRLMSGSYGHCSKCGRWIEHTTLDFDPAVAFCIECWQRRKDQASPEPLTRPKSSNQMQVIRSCSLVKRVEVNPSLEGVAMETLTQFDTICVRTRNSDYRIFLLDPKSGRVMVEGGRHFVEPVEAVVNGSTFGGSTFKVGWIGIGLRIEFLTNDHLVSTSPVQSVRVEHWTSAEPTFGNAET